MTDIPTNEPAQLRAGDTWKWTRSLGDYLASAGWTLKYRFKHPINAGFEIVASASGADHAVTVAAATTTGYTAGKYTWTAWVEGGSSEKYTVDGGTLEVLTDYRAVTAAAVSDNRSHARKVLEAIEAVIEGRAAKDQEEYQIAGRQLKHTPLAELLKFRNRYKQELAAETAAENLANGIGTSRTIRVSL
jgi:hypothetical protein